MGIISWIWNGITSFFGMLLPVFAKAKDIRGLGSKLRWIIHFTLLAIIFVGLAYLNYALDLEKLLDTPLSFLRKVWLPLLYLLIYLLSWVGWWLWRLLSAEEQASFPDIDAAWFEAIRELDKAGIDIAEVPLFLILGRPVGSEKEMFAGAQLDLDIEQIPESPDAPLHVYASREGVFVTCAGASLLGKQAQLLADETAKAELQESGAAAGGASNEQSISSGDSIGAFGLSGKSGELQVKRAADSSNSIGLSLDEREGVARPARKPSTQKKPGRANLLKNTAEVERSGLRLKHLCWLIQQDRRPYCPINGILLMIPYSATKVETDANQTGLICQRDLNNAQEVLQMRYPVIGLVCDMEKAAGFREFIDRFPKGHRQRRLGQQFPYVADLSHDAAADLIGNGVEWIGLELFPPLIYRLMRPEKSSSDKISSILRANVKLYQLLCQMRERRKNLSRILSLAVVSESHDSVLFGGCYLAATGRPGMHEQAFIAAVFHRMIESQNFISWTEDAQHEEHAYRRWTRYGYAALSAFILTFLSMGYWFILRSS